MDTSTSTKLFSSFFSPAAAAASAAMATAVSTPTEAEVASPPPPAKKDEERIGEWRFGDTLPHLELLINAKEEYFFIQALFPLSVQINDNRFNVLKSMTERRLRPGCLNWGHDFEHNKQYVNLTLTMHSSKRPVPRVKQRILLTEVADEDDTLPVTYVSLTNSLQTGIAVHRAKDSTRISNESSPRPNKKPRKMTITS